MKKSLLISIAAAALLIIVSVGVYLYLNASFEKKAKEQIENLTKNNNTIKNFYYKNLKANLFSKSIQLKGIEFEVENKGNITGKVKVKEVVLKGNLNNDYEAEFKNATLINMNINGPTQLIGKTILTAKNGEFEYKDRKGKIKYEFSVEDIKFNKNFFKDLQNNSKQVNEILTDVIKIDNPIEIEGKIEANKNKKTFKVKKYKIDWKNNFSFEYSLKFENINFYKLKKIADELNNNKNQNPLAVLEFFGELGKIKPIKIAFEIKDSGLKERLFNYIKSKDNQTKEQIINELENKLSNSEFRDFKDAIINFVKTDNGKIKLTIENPNKLSISEIIQNANSFRDIQEELKIKLSN
ncbi:hypothetical protein [Hippea alviniae]|uniref:hypothetical protein n=1 Tax=Hippea alviniae TaxID=1279027 RepID=UPI0003B63647|nr:hypothetical protein [Hippea alviniae]